MKMIAKNFVLEKHFWGKNVGGKCRKKCLTLNSLGRESKFVGLKKCQHKNEDKLKNNIELYPFFRLKNRLRFVVWLLLRTLVRIDQVFYLVRIDQDFYLDKIYQDVL